jgi:hypothetical protein
MNSLYLQRDIEKNVSHVRRLWCLAFFVTGMVNGAALAVIACVLWVGI